MALEVITAIKAARDLQAGDRIETSVGFVTVTEVRLWNDGGVEVMYPSLGQMLTVQTFVKDGRAHVSVAVE